MLYIFRSTRFNITNLPHYCTFLCHDNLYGACQPFLNNGKLDVILGQLMYDIHTADPRTQFRDVDWTENFAKLDSVLTPDQNIVFAVNSDQQLHNLKNYYGKDAVTVTTTWDNNSVLLDWLAKFHVRMQDAGLFEITQVDQDLRQQQIDLVSHYRQAFESMNLVPSTTDAAGDYNIPLHDYFVKEKFLQHLQHINAQVPVLAVDFYNSWISENPR